MRTHVQVLGILQLVYGAITMLVGLGIFVLFGGLAALAGANAEGEEALIAVPVLAAIGTFTAVLLVALSLPRLIAGIGLLQHRSWARVLTMIISAVGLLDFPLGTALGIYAFWVLTRPESGALFAGR